MDLKIAEEQKGGVTLLKLEGSLNAGTTTLLFDKIREESEKHGHNRLVLELKLLEFISSAGWSVFVEASKNLREKHGDLVLAEMRITADRIYKIMGLDSWVKCYPTVQDAIEHCQ